MSVQELKNQLCKAIGEIEDKTLLQQIQAMINASGETIGAEEEWNKLPESVRDSIEASLQKVEAGKVVSHNDVKARFSKWFTK